MELNELGLKSASERMHPETVGFKPNHEDWMRLDALADHWGRQTGRDVTNSDILRACVRYTVKALDLMPLFAPGPSMTDNDAGSPPPAPADEGEKPQEPKKRTRKKKPNIRKRY